MWVNRNATMWSLSSPPDGLRRYVRSHDEMMKFTNGTCFPRQLPEPCQLRTANCRSLTSHPKTCRSPISRTLPTANLPHPLHRRLWLNRNGKDWFVLARGIHVCPRDTWSKPDERNTLKELGTDGILLAQGLRKTDTTLWLNRRRKDWFVLARGRHVCPRDA